MVLTLLISLIIGCERFVDEEEPTISDFRINGDEIGVIDTVKATAALSAFLQDNFELEQLIFEFDTDSVPEYIIAPPFFDLNDTMKVGGAKTFVVDSISLEANQVRDGAYTVSIHCIDAAGNKSEKSSLLYILRNLNPSINLTSYTSDSVEIDLGETPPPLQGFIRDIDEDATLLRAILFKKIYNNEEEPPELIQTDTLGTLINIINPISPSFFVFDQAFELEEEGIFEVQFLAEDDRGSTTQLTIVITVSG